MAVRKVLLGAFLDEALLGLSLMILALLHVGVELVEVRHVGPLDGVRGHHLDADGIIKPRTIEPVHVFSLFPGNLSKLALQNIAQLFFDGILSCLLKDFLLIEDLVELRLRLSSHLGVVGRLLLATELVDVDLHLLFTY